MSFRSIKKKVLKPSRNKKCPPTQHVIIQFNMENLIPNISRANLNINYNNFASHRFIANEHCAVHFFLCLALVKYRKISQNDEPII